jgi:hypothetical protein
MNCASVERLGVQRLKESAFFFDVQLQYFRRQLACHCGHASRMPSYFKEVARILRAGLREENVAAERREIQPYRVKV